MKDLKLRLACLSLLPLLALSKPINGECSTNDDDHIKILFSADIEEKNTITALVNTNVREEANANSKKIGLLWGTESVQMIEEVNEDWYKINYYGKIGYVSSKYVEEDSRYYNINCDDIRVGYLNKDIYLPNQEGNLSLGYNKYELGYIIDEEKNSYTLQTSYGLMQLGKDDVNEIDLNTNNYPDVLKNKALRIKHEKECIKK